MPARSTAAWMAIVPSSWAGRLESAPLNEPTGVRAAETMTMSASLMAELQVTHARASATICPKRARRVTLPRRSKPNLTVARWLRLHARRRSAKMRMLRTKKGSR